MIDKYFKFDEWDCADELVCVYYSVELLLDIGDLKAGTKFEFANVDYEGGKLEFGDAGIVEFTFEMSITFKQLS